ncbi:hypothetical protein GLA29479_788 [Lysobacter antibioticus]|nr:hypothetical protein GLA29479_788 [Lysobacter antibioticus]
MAQQAEPCRRRADRFARLRRAASGRFASFATWAGRWPASQRGR